MNSSWTCQVVFGFDTQKFFFRSRTWHADVHESPRKTPYGVTAWSAAGKSFRNLFVAKRSRVRVVVSRSHCYMLCKQGRSLKSSQRGSVGGQELICLSCPTKLWPVSGIPVCTCRIFTAWESLIHRLTCQLISLSMEIPLTTVSHFTKIVI